MRRISRFWRFVLVLAAITVVYAIVAARQGGSGQRDARRARFERETPEALAQVPLPPDAKPYAPRTHETLELRGRFAVVAEQELTRPGAFASTDAFYRRELAARGWKETGVSTVNREYCRAPFTLSVEKSATYDDSHRFTLRLKYDDRFNTCGG